MGLVRGHIENDVAAMAQWVYRKIRNHDPMRQREAARPAQAKNYEIRGGRVTKGKYERVAHVEGSNIVEYSLRTGQRFRLTVEEIDEQGQVVG